MVQEQPAASIHRFVFGLNRAKYIRISLPVSLLARATIAFCNTCFSSVTGVSVGGAASGYSSRATPVDRSEPPPRRPRSFGTPINPNQATAGRDGAASHSARKGTNARGQSPSREDCGTSTRRQAVMDKKKVRFLLNIFDRSAARG